MTVASGGVGETCVRVATSRFARLITTVGVVCCMFEQVSCSSCPAAPSMVVTTLPGSRIIRQSSQPESSAPCCRAACVQHSHSVVSTSLKQLRDHNDGIAGIAADSLRINGAMSNFKQVQQLHAIFKTNAKIQTPSNVGLIIYKLL